MCYDTLVAKSLRVKTFYCIIVYIGQMGINLRLRIYA